MNREQEPQPDASTPPGKKPSAVSAYRIFGVLLIAGSLLLFWRSSAEVAYYDGLHHDMRMYAKVLHSYRFIHGRFPDESVVRAWQLDPNHPVNRHQLLYHTSARNGQPLSERASLRDFLISEWNGDWSIYYDPPADELRVDFYGALLRGETTLGDLPTGGEFMPDYYSWAVGALALGLVLLGIDVLRCCRKASPPHTSSTAR